MTQISEMSTQALTEMTAALEAELELQKSNRLSLDLTRGKPAAEQLDLSAPMDEAIAGNYIASDGTDTRNYGHLRGIPEARALGGELMEVSADDVICWGNSSLALMYLTAELALERGLWGDDRSWSNTPEPKVLTPVPGYDRHFTLSDRLGLKMINVELGATGPDLQQIEELVREDASVKAIWCVPKYSNPTGAVYSDSVVDRLANMKTKADDFLIFWDNAYVVHHLGEKPARLKNILTACKQAGHPDRVLIFGSTSKISFASAGLAMMAGSKSGMDRARKQMSFQTIGPDKLNQLRHVGFFNNMAGIEDHMKKHAAILKPKFDAVQSALEGELGEKNIASWSKPTGGYFVSVDTMEGCAAPVIQMAAEAGVKLTPAGSTFPYMQDPLNRNIRLAPSFPPLEDIRLAMELVGICIQLVSIEKLLG